MCSVVSTPDSPPRLAFHSLIYADARHPRRWDVHTHHELIVPCRGVYVAQLDQGRVELGPGFLLHLPAGMRHRADFALGTGLLFHVLAWHGPALPLPPGQVIADPEQRAVWLLGWMRDHQAAGAAAEPLVAAQLAALLRWLALGTQAAGRGLDPLGRMLTYMRANLQGDIHAGIIAATEQVELRHAERMFASTLGESISAHLQRLRLDAAVDLLRSTSLGLAEIGQRVGIRGRSHLSRLIQGRCGVPPSQLRQQAQTTAAGRLPSALEPATATDGSCAELGCAILSGTTRLASKDFPDPSRHMLARHHGLWRVARGSVVANLAGGPQRFAAGGMFFTQPGDRLAPSPDAEAQVVVFDTGGQNHRRKHASAGGYIRCHDDPRPDPPLARLAGTDWRPAPDRSWIRAAAQPYADILAQWYLGSAAWRRANAELTRLVALHLAQAATEDPLERCAQIFLQRLAQPEPLPQFARRTGVSAATLDRRCRARHGCGLGAWLEDLRLAAARELLLGSAASVAHIARACGYDSASAFIRRFRQRTGRTPGAFRAAPAPDGAAD